MSRQTRVQAPPPPPYSWPATAVTSEPTLTPDVAASYGIAPSMQTMGTSTPPGYWSSSGSPPLMPVKDFSGMDSYPPGDFLSYFKNPSIPAISSQTSHESLVPHNISIGGGHPPYAPVMAPHPSMAKGMIPDNVEICRTDKRLSWTKEEDKRLFSAWLNNSNDPIAGNCKKADRYWQDVTATYNSTTPKNRKREMNQVKDRFHRVNKKVGWFAASWQKATGIYASGQSDLQLQEKALKFYEEDYKQGQFKYMHCWKAVEGWPKWETYMQMLHKLKKRKASEIVEPLEELDSDEDISRPPGNKTAKTEQKNNAKGKGKTLIGIEIDEMEEKLDKFMAAQAEANKGRNDMVEVARLNAVAAKEKKEAKMFSIVRRPARLWSRASIGNIMKACIILHNMIVEDEREMVTTPLDLNETPGSSVVLPPEMKVGGNTCFADVLRRNAGIRDRSTHTQLKRDLVEHIWKRFGN